MQMKYTMATGYNPDNDEHRHGLSVACQSAASIAGGYTLTHGKGGWIDPAGVLVEEPQATITVIGTDEDERLLRMVAARLAANLNQECVLFDSVPLATCEFVAPAAALREAA